MTKFRLGPIIDDKPVKLTIFEGSLAGLISRVSRCSKQGLNIKFQFHCKASLLRKSK